MGKSVSGTKKADKITVTADNVIVVTGKKSTEFPIAKIGKNYIYGVNGKDTIYVKGGKNNFIYGNNKKGTLTAKNTITVSGGTGNKIYGGAGVDTITVSKGAGTGNKIYGNAGNDKITVKYGKKNYYYGG